MINYTVLALIFFLSTISYAGNIDPDADGHKYAWGENAGWLNFEAVQGPGTTVTDTALTGYVWSENTGWIRLDPGNCNDCGVKNDVNGNLTGWAWGENIGWISFSCANTNSCAQVDYGVTIDPYTGEFSGYAWSENIGWIKFDHAQAINNCVKTSWHNDCPDGDSDNDGVSDCIENGAPNNGDGNGDDVPDRNQTHVVSIIDAKGNNYITMFVSGDCTEIKDVVVETCDSHDGYPDGYQYPYELIGFRLPCTSATVRMIYHGETDLSEGYVYRKHGFVPPYDQPSSGWYTLDAPHNEVEFGLMDIKEQEISYVEFKLVDGLLGDDTNEAGWIEDQGGPATTKAATDIPTLNEWGLVGLLILMLMLAHRRIKLNNSKSHV